LDLTGIGFGAYLNVFEFMDDYLYGFIYVLLKQREKNETKFKEKILSVVIEERS
jgi:hypothetical protein